MVVLEDGRRLLWGTYLLGDIRESKCVLEKFYKLIGVSVSFTFSVSFIFCVNIFFCIIA